MNAPDFFGTFSDDDKTIVRPSPGGRKKPTVMPASFNLYAPEQSVREFPEDFLAGSNPLCAEAYPLLSLVPKLRTLPFHHDINDLQEQLIRQVKHFEAHAARQVDSQGKVKIASYFICSLIDETILNTPWGSPSNWGHHSLLIQFHKEARGGERFFQILDRAKQYPGRNLDLLELAYLCLSMGFEGRYRISGGGRRAIEDLRHELFLLIQNMNSGSESALSANWKGLRDIRGPLFRHVPVWVAAIVTAALLMLLYLGYSYAINRTSDRIYGQISALARKENKALATLPRTPVSPAVPLHPAVKFERLLADEIAHNLVEVLDGNILRISNSFPSGSDRIKPEFRPLLTKIAQALSHIDDRVLIVGHSDDRPIFSARFPSNWHLSQARANNVADTLAAAAPISTRVRFEGRADIEPILPNDSPQNRARNRRIDIHIR
jgi:type VI secretion system protein ImpK